MSSDSYRRWIESANNDISRLHRDLAEQARREADKVGQIASIQRSMSHSTSASMLQSKARDIDRVNRDIEQIKKRQADLTRQIADKEAQKRRYESDLLREQERERRRFEQEQQRRVSQYRHDIWGQLHVGRTPEPTLTVQQPAKAYDVFVSHASEDKDSFVRPLAEALQAKGLQVWYDDYVLRVGDSLRRCIDRGLASSRYGIVVLSSAFFAKNWPQYELDGLVTRETSTGEKVILPIWHKVSRDEVASYSPSLADKVALNTGIQTLQEIVEQLAGVLETPHA